MKYLSEFKNTDLKPIKSFYLRDELNPDIWEKTTQKETLKEDIKSELNDIVGDYLKTVYTDIPIFDIVMSGSICNFNWSPQYSDIDIHIITDFSEINADTKLVKAYFDLSKKEWNMRYNISISGFDVELYVQNINEAEESGGKYSIMQDRWITYPDKVNFIPDEKTIKRKAIDVMTEIDNIEEMLDSAKDYKKAKEQIEEVWYKIKKLRKAGLEEKYGEFSIGNLIFKLLRRNGYIGKVMNIREKIIELKYAE